MDILKLGLEMKHDRRKRREVYISQQKLVKLNRGIIVVVFEGTICQVGNLRQLRQRKRTEMKCIKQSAKLNRGRISSVNVSLQNGYIQTAERQ